MRDKPCLTSSDLQKAMAACRAEAENNKWNVSIAIVDDRTAFTAAALVVGVSCAALGACVTALLQRADSDNGADGAADR